MKLPARRGNWQDADTALLRGAVGSIPVVGSILAELVGLTIPNQREERFEAYLKRLSERLDRQEEEVLRQRLHDPENIDLFEEGAFQSVRAVSDERKDYIASIVANGLSGDDKDRLQAKRLLKLLAEVDDGQIIVLASYLHKNSEDDAFRERHKVVLNPIATHAASTQEEIEAAALHEIARVELLRLGLLRADFKSPRKGEIPEFDNKTGMMKANSRSLTPLGRMLLVQIGVAASGDF